MKQWELLSSTEPTLTSNVDATDFCNDTIFDSGFDFPI